ncbi:hypothetical protein [Streptomyces sp. NBC_00986]|uniref:hypothetical protein n=1 Tax=Streptomyces sp. NBC_00986 TaxID=2903702 RepID=UPI00386B4B29|nr:hypothetical protein OG504_45275 [Streptomyces sp. NBC_00986]
MYNLAPANAPWFEHLIDSVRALGEAALEWKLVQRDAGTALMKADRLLHFHEGKVTGRPGPEAQGWESRPIDRTPHSSAVFGIRKEYLDAFHRADNAYELAAMCFASGAAWAVRQVQDGETPPLVVLGLTDDGRRQLAPGSLDVHLDRMEGRYAGIGKLSTAYKRVCECLYAREVAEDIGAQSYVSDHEASQMTDASEAGEGLADAAYAYGLLAERALSFVLLGPKDAHRKQLAVARAEADEVAQ